MKRTLIYLVISFLFALPAYGATGSISSVSHSAKVCHDASCTTPAPGSINFKPTTGTAVVVDTVTGLSGQIWGNQLGWINLGPTGAGVTFSNPTTGLLTGKAWSQVSGWINFAPTGQSVTINPTTGEFSGYAWTGGPFGGWIKFDCNDASSCVKTTWASSGNGGGGSGGSIKYPDVCPNIAGLQASIPSGYSVGIDGSCVVVIDMCPNLAGDQSSVPTGFTITEMGSCIPNIDYCPNITGIQTSVPNGHIVNTKGSCIKLTKDACPLLAGLQEKTTQCVIDDQCMNIDGVQEGTPDGYMKVSNYCYPKELDLCKNREGNQEILPPNTILNENGECVAPLIDICPNISGHQDHVPFGFIMENKLCLFDTYKGAYNGEAIQIIGFPFIPESIKIASNNDFLKSSIKIIGNPEGEFRVDLVSVGLAGLSLIILIMIIRWILRRFMY